MGKQLVVTVKAVDELTGPVRSMTSSILGLGAAGGTAAAKAASAVKSAIGGVFSLKTAVTGLVGALAAKRIFSSIGEAATEMDKVAKAGRRLGVPVELLSSLKYQADLANVSFETLAEAIHKAEKNIFQMATTGNAERGAGQALKLLNVPLKDAQGNIRAVTELLPDLADAINAVGDAGKRAFLTEKIFGNPEMANVLAEGGARLRALSEEARRLGVIFSPAQTEAAEEYRDSITRVGAAWLGLRARLVEIAGPAATELFNKLAGLLAAVPDMAGNLVRTIRESFTGGPGGEEAKKKIGAFFTSLGKLVGTSLKEVGRVALAAGVIGIDMVIETVTGRATHRLEDYFVTLPERFKVWGLKMWAGIDSAFGLMEGGPAGALFTGAAAAAELKLQQHLQALKAGRSSARDTMAAFDSAFAGSDIATFNDSLSLMKNNIAGVAEEFRGASDALLGWGDALARHSVTGLIPKRPSPKTREQEEPPPLAGIGAGLRDVEEQSQITFDKIRELTLSTAEAFSSNLSTAIVDVIGKTKSLKDAFRDFASSTLRQLSEVVMKMIIVRAIGSAIGALSGGTSIEAGARYSIGGGAASPGALPSYGFPAGSMGANTGGIAQRYGFRRFNAGGVVPMAASLAVGGAPWLALAGGGMVPGPDINRDVVRALLTPGEGVITRRGMAAQDHGTLAYMNRGGRVMPAGGGGVQINVNQQITIAGGKSDGESARMAAQHKMWVFDAWAEVLRSNPSRREAARRDLL